VCCEKGGGIWVPSPFFHLPQSLQAHPAQLCKSPLPDDHLLFAPLSRRSTIEMHQLPSRYAVTRFKLAAWALFFTFLLLPAASGVLVYSIIEDDRDLMRLALVLFAGTVLLGFFQWCISFRAHCPLCHAKSISCNGCARHRNARPLCGSHRLRVACTVIFREYFRCPYCGESTAVRARKSALPPRRRY